MIQVIVQAPPPPPVPPMIYDFPAPPPPWVTLPPPVVALISIAFIAGMALVLWPIARAVARRLEGRGGTDELSQQLDDLRERVRDLEGVQHRVAELEERLDFTERLLAQRRDVEQLPRN